MKKINIALLSSFALSTLLGASTLSKELKSNSLVVYNSNIGLVHEERMLDIKKSDTSIIYKGVASTVETDSVNIALPDSITLYSQQYRFDKLTQSKLLNAYINKKVEVRLLKNRNEFKIISATLLSTNASNSIVRTDGYKIITVKSADIIVDEIPEELIIEPSLVWNVVVSEDTQAEMQLDYIINSINFKSDYIVNIENNSSNLTGWITVENRSGKSFENTNLSLLAGNINRISKPRTHYKRAVAMMDSVMSAPTVQEVAHEGYHIYTIPFKVNLANNEKTQIKFLHKEKIDIRREYLAQLSNPLYLNGERKHTLSLYINLEKLDVPLPEGSVRMYSKNKEQTILLGEAHIAHTPKNTPLRLRVGENFDAKIKERLISRDDTSKYYNATVEYEIKNDSDSHKIVTIEVPFNRNRDSKITTKEKYSFSKGNILTFHLAVDANSIKRFQVNYESRK